MDFDFRRPQKSVFYRIRFYITLYDDDDDGGDEGRTILDMLLNVF